MEGGERLVVRDGHILRAAIVLEPGVLRADTWIVETRGYRVRLGDLTIGILQEVRAIAVQHARATGAERCRVASGLEPFPGGFDADETHRLICDVGIEDAHRIRPTAHAS